MASLVMELDQRTTSSCAILFDHEYRIKSFAQFDQIRFLPCMAKNTYGTGFFMLLNTGEAASPSEDGLLTTVGWKFGIFLLKGSVFIAGATVQWQRNGLGIINNSSDVETLALTEDDNGKVFMAPAFVWLGAPYWYPYARGALMEYTRGTNAGYVARATLESITCQKRCSPPFMDSGQRKKFYAGWKNAIERKRQWIN